MKKLITICLAAAVILVIGNAANADWQSGDPYKMHFPQLPNPNGWDVDAAPHEDDSEHQYDVLADDWLCTQTGSVKDIHFWGSWRGDVVGTIENIHLAIHSDIPADFYHPYSQPGEILWSCDTTDYTVSGPFSGVQGWLDPVYGEVDYSDHEKYYQYNITNILQSFYQQEGTIYWLDITVTVEDSEEGGPEWGWKTADVDSYPGEYKGSHYKDDAVYLSLAGYWNELHDPYTGQFLDLAFVITPEPATICLLGIGALSLIRRKK